MNQKLLWHEKETSIEHQIWPNIYTELLMVNEENKKVYKTEQ